MENSASSKVTPFPHGVFLPNGHGTNPILPPNDPTIGYKLNHFMMRIRDPKKSMEFYIDLMGMRTVFVLNAGPFTVYYLGYPQTDEHRVDLAKFAVDTITNLPHTLGLLELFHVHGSEKQEPGFYATGNTPPNLGFGHLGFTVTNVPQALMRFRAHGVPVLKDIGPCEAPIPISDWEKQRGVGVSVKGTESELHPGYAKLLEQIAFVQDPVSLNLAQSLGETRLTFLEIDEEPRLLEPTS